MPRAWLLDAAYSEFSERGLAGAQVDRIAAEAAQVESHRAKAAAIAAASDDALGEAAAVDVLCWW